MRAFAIGSTVLLAVASAVVAQETPPAAAEPDVSGLEEEVRVRLVQTPIIATDRHGRPIGDLTADEIRVKDRGQRREVAFLEPLRRASAAPLPKTLLFIDAPGGEGPAVTESGAAEPRYIAIVVDVENDPALRRQEATDAAVRFVREGLTAETRVAVFSYTGALQQELLFAPVRHEDVVASAVMRAFGRPGRPKVDQRARTRELVSEFEDCVVDRNDFSARANERCLRDVALGYSDQVRPAAQDYLTALDGLIQMMGGLRGHKVIYALSHGVSLDATTEIAEAMRAVIGNTEQVADMINYLGFDQGARQEMDRLIERALREGVVFHFIDRTPPPSADYGANQAHAYQPNARPTLAAHAAAQADLEQIAATTGGTFIAETDVFVGLSEAAALETGTYMLGYYVDEFLSTKQMRKADIDCTRKGVELAHRRGSYDPPARDDIKGQVLVGQIAPAKSRRAEELGLSGHSFVPFQVVADPKHIGYDTADGDATASFTLQVQIQDASGRTVADGFRFLTHSYPRDTWATGDVEPVHVNGWAELPAGSYQMIATLRNADNGRRGEWVVALDVPERH